MVVSTPYYQVQYQTPQHHSFNQQAGPSQQIVREQQVVREGNRNGTGPLEEPTHGDYNYLPNQPELPASDKIFEEAKKLAADQEKNIAKISQAIRQPYTGPWAGQVDQSRSMENAPPSMADPYVILNQVKGSKIYQTSVPQIRLNSENSNTFPLSSINYHF